MKILVRPILLEFEHKDRYYDQFPYSDCETDLLNLINESEIKFDFKNHPSLIFVFKEGKYLFEYSIKSGYLWCSYFNVWSLFYLNYSLNDNKITNLIKNVVEEHFKSVIVKPVWRFGSDLLVIEEHFSLIQIQPNFNLEEKVTELFNLEITPEISGRIKTDKTELFIDNEK